MINESIKSFKLITNSIARYGSALPYGRQVVNARYARVVPYGRQDPNFINFLRESN